MTWHFVCHDCPAETTTTKYWLQRDVKRGHDQLGHDCEVMEVDDQ